MQSKLCKCEGYTYITYENYCVCVEEILAEKKSLTPQEKNKFKNILNFLLVFKQKIALHLKLMKIGFRDLIRAMLEKRFYDMLHILKFDLVLLLKAIGSAQRLVAQGILKILKQLVTAEKIQLFKKKLIKIDMFIKDYPILKYLTGIALSGLLIFMWTQMTFIGDFDFDFDLQNAIYAVLGTYTLSHLFGTDEGLLFLTLFFTGFFKIISFNWILGTPYLIAIMLMYSVVKNKEWRRNIKSFFKVSSQKVSTTVYHYTPVKKFNYNQL